MEEVISKAIMSLEQTGRYIDPRGVLLDEECEEFAKRMRMGVYRDIDDGDGFGTDRCYSFYGLYDEYTHYIQDYLAGLEGEDDDEAPLSFYDFLKENYYKVEC